MKKSSSDGPKLIIIIGPPGSGKGTQANLLAEKFGLCHLETSKVIESKINGAKKNESVTVDGVKYPLNKEFSKWEKGLLNSPPLVAFWMKKRIRDLAARSEGLIFSGSPRTLYEVKVFFPIIRKLYGFKNIKVVFLKISFKEAVFRNSHRKICQLMRHPILYSKETEGLKNCPLDGSKLESRKGLDDPKTILVRLKRFEEETLPVIDYLKKQKVKIISVNGSPVPAKVFSNIVKSLGK
jgi:adenylate kinase